MRQLAPVQLRAQLEGDSGGNLRIALYLGDAAAPALQFAMPDRITGEAVMDVLTSALTLAASASERAMRESRDA